MADDGKCVVYGLASSGDGIIRYIGQTVKLPEQRLANHLDAAVRRAAAAARRAGRHSPLTAWITDVVASGEDVLIEVLCHDAVLHETERAMILGYQQAGFDLVNATEGGQGRPGYVMPAYVRAQISQAHKGRLKSAKHRAAIARSRTGTTAPLETRAKMSAAKKGFRPANLDAVHLANRGRPLPVDHRAKLSAAHMGLRKGVPHSSAHRENLSTSWTDEKKSSQSEKIAKGWANGSRQPYTPEQLARRSAWMTERNQTVEHPAWTPARHAKVASRWTPEKRAAAAAKMTEVRKRKKALAEGLVDEGIAKTRIVDRD
jgi:NUMOD3 motif